MAMSVPAPMAMPTSAQVSAGASLMPSPTIATRPTFCKRRTTSALPSGRTPATTWSTPAACPTACAVRGLSPVIITTRMPILRSSATASGLSSFTVSATAIMPRIAPSRLNSRGVLPSPESFSAAASRVSGTLHCPCMYFTLPPRSSAPSRFAVRPLPGSAAKSDTSCAFRPFSSAYCTTAFASGCSEGVSSDSAASKRSFSPMPSAGSTSVTRI